MTCFSARFFRALFLLVASLFLGACGSTIPVRTLDEGARQVLALADAHYAAREDVDRLNEARRLLEGLRGEAGDRPEILERLAAVLVRTGEATPGEPGDAVLEEGRGIAYRLTRIAPRSAAGWAWLAEALWAQAERGGHAALVFRKDALKEACERTLHFDPDFEGAAGNRILGKTLFENTWITGGSPDQARNHLETAWARSPTHPENALWLAKVYLYLGRDDDAQPLLDLLLTREPDPRWRPEAGVAQDEAHRMLAPGPGVRGEK